MSAPMLAQEIVPDGPTRTKDDARQIFMQDFEKDWDKWIDDTIDVITTIEYYNHPGDSAATNDIASYVTEETLKRDSVIYMKNGVMTTDDKTDIAGKAFANDQYTILTDQDNERNSKLEKFGTDGGEKYFYYSADHKLANTGNAYTKGVVDNYRRNLFVRGIDIEPETSYRLTLYLKVNQPLKTEVVPTFFADVMQGYFHSEKPFLSTVEDSKDWMGNPSKTFNAFEYKQTEFTGDWEKVTFMTYYNGDSLQSLIYHAQYWWNGDDWKWNVYDETGKKTQYFYIKQPQKYFVRLSFASDSTDFCVDNVSLTKSWIGGVEYYNNKIRVDFGYETNLKDLANAKVATTNIDAIELPGEYFKVLGYYAEDGDWYEIPINSAEYHGDGYMYMWTKDDEFGDPITFDYYDTVLVSFINPVDSAELALKYTNSKIYPKSTDTEWAKTKFVPNFYNELATPNPNVFDGVYSMKFLPPVVQKLGFEDGSFQLPVTTKELSFSFSREVVWEENATPQTEHSALLKLVGNGKTEYWFPKNHYNNDSTIVFVRPESYISANGNLNGDYEVQLSQIAGYGTDEAKPVSFKYSFGEVKMPAESDHVSFEEFDVEASYTKGGVSQNVADLGFSAPKTATKIQSFPGLYGKALMFGNYGQAPGGQSGSEKTCMRLVYTFKAKESGNALVEFGWTGCLKNSWNDDCVINVVLSDIDDNEIGRIQYGSSGFKPEEGATVNEVAAGSVSGTVVAGKEYKFTIYLINESGDNAGHAGGLVLYYLNVSYGLCLGTPYVLAFDDATAKLAATLKAAEANADNYTGIVYDASASVQKQYADFKSLKETAPSVWNKVTAEIKAANSSLMNRMGVVDALWAAWDAADLKASETLTADAQFEGNGAWIALSALLEEVDEFIPSAATDDSIKAVQKSIEDASKAVDDFKAELEKFNAQLDRVKKLVEDADVPEAEEYATMSDTYKHYSSEFDKYGSTIEEIQNATKELMSDANAYLNVQSIVPLSTARMKALQALSTQVGGDDVLGQENVSSLAEIISAAKRQDDKVVEVYKSAIKLAIYKKFQNEAADETIDLTPFIDNAGLYTNTAHGEEDDLGTVSVQTGWGWPATYTDYSALKRNSELYNVFPGWKTTTGGGQVYPGGYIKKTPAEVDEMPNFADSWVAFDWNSMVSLEQEVTNLPEGMYELGSFYHFSARAENNKAGNAALTGIAFLTAKVGDTEWKLDVADSETPENMAAEDIKPADHWVDSVMVADSQSLTIIASNSGQGQTSWGVIDNFELKFKAKTNAGYAAYVAAEEGKLNELITFVDPFSADSKVEYIGLDGVKMNAPKAGQVSIKVTRKADGARVIEKVLVK